MSVQIAGPAVVGRTGEEQEIERDIESYLARHEQKELCRFVAVGSVDDGKSTLIGRLLHDTKGLYEDQLAAVARATRKRGAAAGHPAHVDGDEPIEIDFSLFTDGLKAEREQGITIDVAYRYFSTDKRKFIIADTPGHVQYTRNMATGASTADVAIILLDARLGVLPQSRRHAYIASLLGIRHLIVAVNKMDLVDYARDVFDRLSVEFGAFAARLSFSSVRFFPISAKRGDNVVAPSMRTPWFTAASPPGQATILSHLETVPLARDRRAEPLRFPVQYVIRPHLDYRGFAGQIGSGVVRAGDEVVALPSGRRTKVKAVDTFEGPVDEAAAPLSVTLRLEDEIDLSRGDMLVHASNLPRVERRFDAMVVWLSERPFDPARALLVKQTTRMVPARVERVHEKIDLETLAEIPTPTRQGALTLNDIGRVTVRASRPLLVDAYAKNRVTGAFILVDALSNDTVAAGMILGAGESGEGDGVEVTRAEREARLGQRGAVLFARGDVAPVERALHDRGLATLAVAANEVAGLDAGALVELCVRAAVAGLAVIAGDAPDAARDAIAARLGEARVLGAFDEGGVDGEVVTERLLDRFAALTALSD